MKVSPGSKPARAPALKRSFAALAARHWPMIVVLVPATLLRINTMLGFRWALWFNDSYQYVQFAVGSFRPDLTRPSGYSIYLRILKPLHSFAIVSATQHLMGLAIGVMIYALLVHRFKVPRWLAALAAVPALYDTYQIELEHLLMADTPFAVLTTAAITIVMWRPKPGITRTAVAGLLLGMAAITRSIGLPLLAILAVYLLIRRVGWRAVGACIAAAAVPVGSYVLWFHATYGQYAMTESTGIFLYSRVMAFADCSKLNLPPDETALCTSAPPDHRKLSQLYIWAADAPLRRFPPPEFSPLNNMLAKGFATRAIEAQPLAYARVAWDDTWRSFAWERKVFPDPITYGEYEFASASRGPARKPATGHGFGISAQVARYVHGSGITRAVEPYAGVMRVYQKYVFLPGTILGVLLIVGFGGMVAAWRRLGGEILLPWSVAIAMIVIPAATAEFDYRYLLPAVPFACLAAAMVFGPDNPVGRRLAARRVARRRARPTPREPAPVPGAIAPSTLGRGGTGNARASENGPGIVPSDAAKPRSP